LRKNSKLGLNTQQWVYRAIATYFSKNNQFDLLEFTNQEPNFLVKDYNTFETLQGGQYNESSYNYKFYGQLMEGHIDYWFPLDTVHNCTVFAGYQNCIKYSNNVLSLGFDYFDFYVHEIFSNPMFYNEINRTSIQHAEYDIVIPAGTLRDHRREFLKCMAQDRRELSIVLTVIRMNCQPI